MAVSVHDYLIEQAGVDWSATLSDWSWLVPQKFTLWLVNRLCDLFIVTPDGAVHMLDVGCGTLKSLAGNRDDFRRLIDEDRNANVWLAIPLVNDLMEAGLVLQPGYCYGFKVPPVLGGQYSVENCAVLPIPDYLGACGSIHDQLRGVTDGSHVVITVSNDSA